MTAPRYEALVKLAAGGMATVWIGTARGALGFRQLVAIKKPHPHLLDDPSFKEELIAEARLASMIRHANVVDVRDVEEDAGSISLVMDFIEGASLGELLVAASQRAGRIPPRVAVRIACDALAGLHAAHELVDERSRPVGLVHRDVSPQNILVGEDGIARVTDFGVAKFARKNMQSTSAGSLKGKLAYMAPEYLRSEPIDRRLDVFALGVVLWESLTGRRCFRGESEAETFRKILEEAPPRMSSIVPELRPLDDVVSHALEKSTSARFQNAAALARALEQVATASGFLGSHAEVALTVKELCGAKIDEKRAQVRSKLAHEPSLQSLGADTVMSPLTQAPPTEPMPATEAPETEPPATVTSDHLRGGATLVTPTAPRFGDHVQPITASAYEIERTPPPPRRAVPMVALVLGALVLGGLAVAGGMSLGRGGGAPVPSASIAPVPPAVSTAAPVAIATSAPAAVESVVAPPPRPIAIPKPVAAPKPVATPSASTKRPPANPYE